MNCLGKLILDHPNWDERKIRNEHESVCPSDHNIMSDPENLSLGKEKMGCVRCWSREIPGTEPTITAEAVNHPKHYGREGAMECIDEMLLVFGTEPTMYFCLLNSWKYRYRAADKGGEEDLKKSDWYLAKYAELKGVTTVAP